MKASLTPARIAAPGFLADLAALAAFGAEGVGVMRIAYSAIDMQARDWVDAQLRDLGCAVRRDAIGNSIARLPGAQPGLKAIALGSHTDTVPHGGRFDGALGVLAALACARAAGRALRHPLEIINFMAEEATMSGGTTGSQIMSGRFNPAQFEQPAWDGLPVREHFTRAGFDSARWREAVRAPGELAAYLELHIEQGALLTRAGAQIGIVEGMVGVRRFRAFFTGVANHAGTTPMHQRDDALVKAAPFVGRVREEAQRHGIIGTVGSLTVQPGAPNVIPGRVEMVVELRALDVARLNTATDALTQIAMDMGGALTLTVDKPAAPCDARLKRAITDACAGLGLMSMPMPSGAFHDAANMAALCPQAMIFAPSPNGVSHSPLEYTPPDDCVNGANALLNTLLILDEQLD